MKRDDRTKVVGKTLKLLYSNPYECQDNKERVKKYIQRHRRQFTNTDEKNYLFLDINQYDYLQQAEFFAKCISLENSEIDGVTQQVFDNINKLKWNIDLSYLIAYFLSDTLDLSIENIVNQIKAMENKASALKSELRNKIRCKCNIKRGKKESYSKLVQDRDQLLKEFLENNKIEENWKDHIVFYCLEVIVTDFIIQVLVYHITDNKNWSHNDIKKKLDTIYKKLNNYEIKSGKKKENSIFVDFSVKLISLNRQKEIQAYCRVMDFLRNQITNGYSMEIEKKYLYERSIIGIEKKEQDIIDYLSIKTKNIPETWEDIMNSTRNVIEEQGHEKCYIISDVIEIQEMIKESNVLERNSRFQKKLEESWEDCLYLNKYQNRKLFPFYFQHIKSVFREIILDKEKYLGTSARTIMKKMRNSTQFSNMINDMEQQLFVLEKISRGLYRERGIGCLYSPRINVQSLYYKKIKEIYQISSAKMAIEELKRFICYVDNIYQECFE